MITPESIRDESMDRFNELAPAKYDCGQLEHGGLLTQRDLLADMEMEVVDFWFYLQGERIKRKHLSFESERMEKLEWALKHCLDTIATECIHLSGEESIRELINYKQPL